MNHPDAVRVALLTKPSAEETYPFGSDPLVAKIGGKMFALLARDAPPGQLSLKIEPAYGEVLRATYPAIKPGYHLNKQHWVTFILDGSLADELVQALIDDSYRLVRRGLTRAAQARLAAQERAALSDDRAPPIG